MKHLIFFVFFLVLLISEIKVKGQILITKSDSIALGQDTFVKLVLPEYRGNVNWQQSLNKINWVTYNIEENDTLYIDTETEAYYRAKISDGNCDPVYSDTIKIDTDSIRVDYNKTTIEMAFPDSIGIGMNFFIDNDTFFVKKINNKYIFQGDIILTDEQLKINSTLKGATMPNYNLWPNNTVFYIIHSNLNSNANVLKGINHWNEKTTLNFIKWTGQANYIFIELGDGNYSNLGMIGGQQEIKLASNANLNTVIHEIGHAVGLIHEHSRSNRDDYIIIHKDNIKIEKLYNFEKKRNSVSQYDDFDFNSVMLYPCYSDNSVAIDPAEPIITRKDCTVWNTRSKLSQGDINTIKFLYPPITDSRDGKTYKWVKIGDQTWMAENLAYLPSVSPSNQGSATAPYYYVYDYQGTDVVAAKTTDNYKTYGVLYNWPAAMAGAASSSANPSKVQGVCPGGWHLPSVAEWNTLINYLIENGFAHTRIAKAIAANENWKTIGASIGTPGNDMQSNNKSGFTGLPAGRRSSSNFQGIGEVTNWWTSEGHFLFRDPVFGYSMLLDYDSPVFQSLPEGSSTGFSIRCIKD